jgi:hypothetical protein
MKLDLGKVLPVAPSINVDDVCSVDKKAYQKRPIKKAINGIWLF